jgi:transcriptional regulator with XRE-family HTH domain
MGEQPIPAWVSLGKELRRLRAQTGLSLDATARHLSITGGMLGKVERGTRALKRDTATELDQFFGTDGALLRRWSDATNTANDPEWFKEIRRSEERATEIRTWAPLLIPGFLQVPDYTRALFRVSSPLKGAEEGESLVAGRLERFESLTRKGGPTLWVVLCESVLRRRIGGTATMIEQLDRLIDMGESRRVRTQVVPADLPDSPGNGGPFRLITTTDGGTVLYAEGSGGGSVIDDRAEMRRHLAVFEDLRGVALPPAESVDLIGKVRDGLDLA